MWMSLRLETLLPPCPGLGGALGDPRRKLLMGAKVTGVWSLLPPSPPPPGPLTWSRDEPLCDLDQKDGSHQQSRHQGGPATWQEGRP